MSLLDRHIAFTEALRGAGVSASLAEGLDAVKGLGRIGWGERDVVREVYAATLIKRHAQRPTFDALFDLYFPALIGSGVQADREADQADRAESRSSRDNAAALQDFRARLEQALADGDQQALNALAVEAVARFGAMPGRGPGLSSWSAYTALQRVSPTELADRLVQALLTGQLTDEEAERAAHQRIGDFSRRVENDARRRIAEEKGAEHVANVALRPTIDRLDFTSARKADLEEMRREIYPLARRLATRLT